MSLYDEEPEELDDDEEPFAEPGELDDEDELEIPGVGGDEWEAEERDEW